MTVQARMLMVAPLLWVLLAGAAAQAALPDPTRPPAGLATAAPGATPLPRGAPADGLTTNARPARPAPAMPAQVPRVQALHLPTDAPPGSASALIDGRLVRSGDRLGDATVQEIRPDGVWLRLSRGGTQWLGLFALVELPTAEPLTATAPGQNAPRKEP